MNRRPPVPHLPADAIRVNDYAHLDRYLSKFARGELGLVLLLGRPGTGKSEHVRRAIAVAADGSADENTPSLYVEGHVQPFGLYKELWLHRDRPVVLDDLDRLYADPACVRLLKPLCNTTPRRRIHWLTRSTAGEDGPPAQFSTSSSVILIANEWKSLNPNVRALEDRAIILHFEPSNDELHRKVGEWFDDPEVYALMASLRRCVPHLSMRHYRKGSALRKAGFDDWKENLLQMAIPDRRVAAVLAAAHDTTCRTEQDRIARFVALTGASRATYFRIKQKLGHRP